MSAASCAGTPSSPETRCAAVGGSVTEGLVKFPRVHTQLMFSAISSHICLPEIKDNADWWLAESASFAIHLIFTGLMGYLRGVCASWTTCSAMAKKSDAWREESGEAAELGNYAKA